VLGDPTYGAVPNERSLRRLHLLARAISLPLDPPVSAAADPPAHMLHALRACGWQGDRSA
jgi:hypothetical protein